MENTFSGSKVLLVDDEVEVCEVLQQFLEDEGFEVAAAHDGEQALAKLDEFLPQCVLLDIRMPSLNGIEVLKMVKYRKPETEVIMVTAVSNIKIAEECMRDGAFGFIPKPVDLDYLLKEIRGALSHREEVLEKQNLQLKENRKFEDAIQALNEELASALRFPLDLIELNYPELGCHSKNVAWLCKAMASQMGMSQTRLCELGGLYHDIGQLCLPRSLQNKPLEKMSYRERGIFEKFPLYGESLVQSHFHLKGLCAIIKHQGENVDGTGFPGRLRGNDIPLESKIIAVASAFDEELKNLGLRNIEQDIFEGGKVLDAINSRTGKRFDPAVVSALDAVIKEYKYKSVKEVKVAINNLKPNMSLSRDVFAESGELVLARQTIFTPLLLSKIFDLISMGVSLSPIYIHTDMVAEASASQ